MNTDQEILDSYTASLLGGRLRFGSYPAKGLVDVLVRDGFTFFVDLTSPEHDCLLVTLAGGEYPYSVPPSVTVKHYPTKDRTPGTIEQALIIVNEIIEQLNNGIKVYVHCRGGHGRSAVIAAIVLIELGVENNEALAMVRLAHQKRLVMDDKWRKIGAPQTRSQKQFVKNWVRLTDI